MDIWLFVFRITTRTAAAIKALRVPAMVALRLTVLLATTGLFCLATLGYAYVMCKAKRIERQNSYQSEVKIAAVMLFYARFERANDDRPASEKRQAPNLGPSKPF